MSQTLTIDRGQWLTGKASELFGGGTLRDPKTRLMCCLGFLCKQDRFFDSQLNNIGMPQNVDSQFYGPEHWLSKEADEADHRHGETRVGGLLADANDGRLHPIRKEARIKKLFKKYGDIDVVFVGKYAEATKKAREAAEN